MRRVKKACVSSSAIPSWWSTQPSRVTLMVKVKSPMATSLLQVGRTALLIFQVPEENRGGVAAGRKPAAVGRERHTVGQAACKDELMANVVREQIADND